MTTLLIALSYLSLRVKRGSQYSVSIIAMARLLHFVRNDNSVIRIITFVIASEARQSTMSPSNIVSPYDSSDVVKIQLAITDSFIVIEL